MQLKSHTALTTLATHFLLVGLGLVTGILTARLLGPSARGDLASIVTAASFVAGAGLMSLRESVAYHSAKNQIASPSLLPSAILAAFALAVVSCVFGGFIFAWFFSGHRERLLSTALLYLLLLIPSNFLVLAAVGAAHGHQRYNYINVQRIVGPLTYLIGIGVIVSLDLVSVKSFAMVGAASTVVLLVPNLWEFRRWLRLSINFPEIYLLLTTGLKFHSLTVLMILGALVDQLVVVALLPSSDVGLYVVALSLAATASSTLSNAVHDLLFPKVASISDIGSAGELIARGLRLLTLGSLVAASAVVLACPLLLPLMFGSAYRDAVVPCQVLAVGCAFVSLRQVAARVIRSIEMNRAAVIAELTAITSFVGVATSLVGTWGILGVGVSLLVSACLAYAVLVFLLRLKLAIHINDILGFNFRTCRELHCFVRAMLLRATTR